MKNKLLLIIVVILFLSCKAEEDFIQIWGDTINPPRFQSLELISENEIIVGFSSQVKVLKASVFVPGKKEDEGEQQVGLSWQNYKENKIKFILSKQLEIGEKARLSALISDEKQNSLSMVIPFTGFNFLPAKLKINEIRTSYSKPRVEFLEFIVEKEGNLGGIEVENAANINKPFWEFPACEVSKGEFIVLHFRSIEEGLVDEINSLDESLGTEALPTARDFWDDQARAPLKQTNVIVVRDRKGGQIQDAFLGVEEGTNQWPTMYLEELANEVSQKGFWSPNGKVENAFTTTGMTPTRTAGKNPDANYVEDLENSKNNWKICATSKASPGKQNEAW